MYLKQKRWVALHTPQMLQSSNRTLKTWCSAGASTLRIGFWDLSWVRAMTSRDATGYHSNFYMKHRTRSFRAWGHARHSLVGRRSRWVGVPISGNICLSTVDIQKSLRVQVPNNHILTQNLYHNYYYPNPKYLIIGYMDPPGIA